MANTTFNTTPQPQQTLSGLFSPLSNMNSQIKNSPITNPTAQSSAPIPVSPAQQYQNPATSSMVGSNPVILPSTPVKKTTNIDATGNTTTTEYHAPDVTSLPPDDPSHKYNTATGQLNPNYKDPNAPASTNYSSSNPATFSGLINQGANASGTAANTGSTNYNTANTGLLNATAGNQQYQDNAANIANAAGQKISDIGGQGARGEAGYLTTGTSPVGEGNSAVLAQTTAAQQQAVAQGANMQLAGNAQGLTGEQQQQQGYNQASGNALTSQGQGISGLNSAAGNTQPRQQGYVNLNPLNPDTSGGAGSAASAAAMGGNIQAAEQNAITGGTAAVNAGAAAYAQNNPAYAKLAYQTVPNIEGFGNLLMQGAGGINPFDAQYANMTLQQFQNQLSSPAQAAFQTTFQQLKRSIADLAGAGGSQTPTANSSQSDNTLSPTSKLSTIQSTLQRIAAEGKQYLTTAAALSNANLNQAQGGGTSGSGTGAFSDSSFYGQQ